MDMLIVKYPHQRQRTNVDEILRSKSLCVCFFFSINHLFDSVVRHHHGRHLDLVVVVRLKVQNHPLLGIIPTATNVHLRRNIIQIHHHPNDIVERVVMLIMADVSAPFVHPMSKVRNGSLVYSIIAIMSCMFPSGHPEIIIFSLILVVMNVLFHGNVRSIVMPNRKGKKGNE